MSRANSASASWSFVPNSLWIVCRLTPTSSVMMIAQAGRPNGEKETVKEFSTVRRLSDRGRLNAALRLGGDVPCLSLQFELGGRT